MQHMVQKHGGQLLLADSVGRLRWLNRQACVACETIRSTPLRKLRVGDTSQERRQPGHQDAGASDTAAGQQLTQENLWTTARFQTALIGTSF